MFSQACVTHSVYRGSSGDGQASPLTRHPPPPTRHPPLPWPGIHLPPDQASTSPLPDQASTSPLTRNPAPPTCTSPLPQTSTSPIYPNKYPSFKYAFRLRKEWRTEDHYWRNKPNVWCVLNTLLQRMHTTCALTVFPGSMSLERPLCRPLLRGHTLSEGRTLHQREGSPQRADSPIRR